jgi:hypothetical protein
MPWIALVCLCLVGACRFDADYSGGPYRCEQDKCPDGLVCDDLQSPAVCIAPRQDAAIDSPPDDSMVDARVPELRCGDPGKLSPTGGTVTGSTAGKMNLVTAQCSTGVMNGFDDVYEIEAPAGKQVTLAVSTTTMGYAVTAYMITPCPSAACMSADYAVPGNPATITTTIASPQYVVVDSIIANTGGAYTLIVTVAN